MSTAVSVGYLRPAPGTINPVACEVSYGGYPVTDDGTAPDWHYLTNLAVEWQIDVDLPTVRRDCGLSPTGRLGALLTWHSDRTNMRGGNDLVILTNGVNALRAELPGTLLGGTLTVDARVVLARQDAAAQPLAPTRAGTLLWYDTRRVVLEGDAGRWPTNACDFAEAGIPGGRTGLWYLEVTTRDLGSAASQCLLLHLNTAHPDINELLNRPDNAHAALLHRALRYDTYRQLLTLAVTDDEFDDRARYDRGSLGDLLVTVVRTLAPGRTIDQVRSEYTRRPTETDAETMARSWPQDT
jgi:hypothetical protein